MADPAVSSSLYTSHISILMYLAYNQWILATQLYLIVIWSNYFTYVIILTYFRMKEVFISDSVTIFPPSGRQSAAGEER